MQDDTTLKGYRIFTIFSLIVEKALHIVDQSIFHTWVKNNIVPTGLGYTFEKLLILGPLFTIIHPDFIMQVLPIYVTLAFSSRYNKSDGKENANNIALRLHGAIHKS